MHFYTNEEYTLLAEAGPKRKVGNDKTTFSALKNVFFD